MLRHCWYYSHFHCYIWPIYSSKTFLNYWCNSEACNWYHFGDKASCYQLMTWHMIWADQNVITDGCDCSKTQLIATSPPSRLCPDNGCRDRVDKVKDKTICHQPWRYFKWRLVLFPGASLWHTAAVRVNQGRDWMTTYNSFLPNGRVKGLLQSVRDSHHLLTSV